jgi:hypothetical protein
MIGKMSPMEQKRDGKSQNRIGRSVINQDSEVDKKCRSEFPTDLNVVGALMLNCYILDWEGVGLCIWSIKVADVNIPDPGYLS